MTATDELHFLLCEHGACHAEGMLMGHPITYWGKQEQDGRWPYRYWDFEDGTASFSADPKDPSQTITPEQAIAATLGSCNCSDNCTNGERTSDELLPCPFCGAKAEVWQDSVRTWGLIEHKPDCWLAYDIPRHKQEIPHAEFAAWNRRAE